jgi:hypothetical protein
MTCNGDCNQGRECNCECKKETKMKASVYPRDDGTFQELSVNPNRYHPVQEQENPKGIKVGDTVISGFGKTAQTKQPKYLYVYYRDKVYFLQDKDASNRYYIGKIEVNDD